MNRREKICTSFPHGLRNAKDEVARWLARIEPIAPSTFSAWRETWGDDALLSDAAVRDLRSRIGSHHFFVVVTCTFNGQPQPLSWVFQSPAPSDIVPTERWFAPRSIVTTQSAKSASFVGDRAVVLRQYDPIISMQGEKPCCFAEALAHAETMARWSNCSIIYTYDDSVRGHA